jgi:SAM-dependent methyltransferase
MNLTEILFWEDYWRNCAVPSEVNQSSPFDRCLAKTLVKRLSGIHGEVFEVGCAPGKWLAFMVKTFGMKANGIEYSDAGMKATRRNFQALNLPIDTIIAGDFFDIRPEPRFDVVMSFGFIEHFDKPDAVVARHAAWLKPGGKLIIGVPNFSGIYKPLQTILDRSILDKHNLNIMHLGYFRGLAQPLRLELQSLEYIASFEPSLPVAKRGFTNLAKFLVKVFLRVSVYIRRSPILDDLNASWLSAYILAIYRKPTT